MRRRTLLPLVIAAAGVIALLGAPLAHGASVRPLEVVNERIIRLEMERLASEHILATELVRRSLEKLNQDLNITSPERIALSRQLLDDAREAYGRSVRSGGELSAYATANRARLKEGGHERFIPLGRLYEEVEVSYNGALDRYLATSTQFVQFCGDHLDDIATGQPTATKRYDELYAAYLRDMESFNVVSMQRSQRLADWTALHPALLEFLPR